MNVNLSELIAALPADERQDQLGLAPEQLREIFADLAHRPVPVHSLHRLWSAGELSAQIALASFALWMRSWFENTDARTRDAMETRLRLALKTFHRLGYMRGAMTKIGQAIANFPSLLPAGIAETLEKLHFEAPPMHYALIREVLADELGGDPEEVFAHFDRHAFAAASLGQVHRAVLKSGEEVAVKVQYPGIARTIDADFRNLSALLFPMRFSKDWDSLHESFAEIQRMLKLEADYVEEAENLRRAAALFTPEDGIVVPRVYSGYSTKRVLTMEYLRGLHPGAFLANDPPQRSRDAFGTKLYLAWTRLFYGDLHYGDSHPGNYLFLDDGRLGLLDFGCVQRYGDEERELRVLADRVYENREALPEFLRRAARASERDLANPEYVAVMRQSFDWMDSTTLVDGEFDFGDERHLREGLDWSARLVRQRQVKGNPTYLYLFRSTFALKALLYRLRAQVNVRRVFMQERKRVGYLRP
jgi:predicted unusual protein kinase regulating ubiquinone biosynthesis (AarF/ABC1/UbiB family)